MGQRVYGLIHLLATLLIVMRTLPVRLSAPSADITFVFSQNDLRSVRFLPNRQGELRSRRRGLGGG